MSCSSSPAAEWHPGTAVAGHRTADEKADHAKHSYNAMNNPPGDLSDLRHPSHRLCFLDSQTLVSISTKALVG
jgi:hypothetical protein